VPPPADEAIASDFLGEDFSSPDLKTSFLVWSSSPAYLRCIIFLQHVKSTHGAVVVLEYSL
jgi:hypothetical protein